MKNGIETHKYYFLLEWKDKNLPKFQEMFGEDQRLCDLPPKDLECLYIAIESGLMEECEKERGIRIVGASDPAIGMVAFDRHGRTTLTEALREEAKKTTDKLLATKCTFDEGFKSGKEQRRERRKEERKKGK